MKYACSIHNLTMVLERVVYSIPGKDRPNFFSVYRCPHHEPCPKCGGKGSYHPEPPSKLFKISCDQCIGTGIVRCMYMKPVKNGRKVSKSGRTREMR